MATQFTHTLAITTFAYGQVRISYFEVWSLYRYKVIPCRSVDHSHYNWTRKSLNGNCKHFPKHSQCYLLIGKLGPSAWNTVNIHTHYNLFSQPQQFFQQFYNADKVSRDNMFRITFVLNHTDNSDSRFPRSIFTSGYPTMQWKCRHVLYILYIF